jgi:hypothetical protein
MKNMWIDGAFSIQSPSPACKAGVRSSPTVRSRIERATRILSPTTVPRVAFRTVTTPLPVSIESSW